jgi:hypothetical protein
MCEFGEYLLGESHALLKGVNFSLMYSGYSGESPGGGKNRRGVALVTHPPLAPRLKK